MASLNGVLKNFRALTLKQPYCYISLCHNHTATEERYGYTKNSEEYLQKDTSTEGILHIGITKLPDPLKDSLQLFLQNKSKKQITADGIKLSRHLKNRGRPTHSTWTKYKHQHQGKKEDRKDVKHFSIEEAVKEGLVDAHHLPITADTHENDEDDVNKKQKKKQMKRPKLVEYSMVRYGKRETSAYIASQLPSVYGATYRALHEIKQRLPEYSPQTLLDFGSGSGMSVWASNSIWNGTMKEYQCIDASEDMNNAAEYLLRGSKDINEPLKIPNVYFKRFLPLSNQIMYDIVISSFTLTEMPFRSQRLQAIKTLWRKTNDFLIIVEPGNNEGFDTTLAARDFVTQFCSEENASVVGYQESLDPFDDFDIEFNSNEDEGHIFAPCPHEQTCARSIIETRDHPCNFNQKVELSFSQRNSPLRRHGHYSESFSYIILKKGKENSTDESTKGWTRILKPIKSRKGHVLCELCCSNGNIEKHIITKKKDPYIYKAARHRLNWGDMLPLSEAKRPMNIRKPIPPTSK